MNMDNKPTKIPRRIAQTVVNSLKGGVVPRVGLPYITVGRRQEIEALLRDVDIVSEGGAAFRFIAGNYGSGKSFLLQTMRNYVMDRNVVVMAADLSPERRLYGNQGQGLATYRELIKNLSIKTQPEGGALANVLDRWISTVQMQTAETAGCSTDSPEFAERVEQQIFAVVRTMHDLVHGFDFARLLSLYYRAFAEGDDELKGKVLNWFRGEYANKSEARADLGVNVAITDDNWYDYLKLFAFFFHSAGYSGLIILVDELVNLYKIPNSIARQYNYEKLLAMYNDALQGKARYIGTLMSGTPQSIADPRRGLYSYEALRSRLQEGKFTREQGVSDLLAPVIKLRPLTAEEMTVLTEKIALIHAGLYEYEPRLTDDDLVAFIRTEYARIGADTHITPREVIRDFIELLDLLFTHADLTLDSLLQSETFNYAKPELEEKDIDAEFAEFTL